MARKKLRLCPLRIGFPGVCRAMWSRILQTISRRDIRITSRALKQVTECSCVRSSGGTQLNEDVGWFHYLTPRGSIASMHCVMARHTFRTPYRPLKLGGGFMILAEEDQK